MKIIAVVSGKGGVGKTTICANLSAALIKDGHTVLSVDMDPQNGLGFHFDMPTDHLNGMARATLSGSNWNDAIFHPKPGGMVLPYGMVDDSDRALFETQLAENPRLLLEQLKLLDLPEDSFVLLDTPPEASVYSRQAFAESHVTVLTLLADASSLSTATKYIRKINKECYGRPGFMGHMLVVNQVDHSHQLNSDTTHFMRETLGSKYFSIVHRDQAIPEALVWGQSLLEYDAQCRGARDFVDLVRKLKELMANAKVTN